MGHVTKAMSSDKNHWYFKDLTVEEFSAELQRRLTHKLFGLPDPELESIFDDIEERLKGGEFRHHQLM